MVRPGGPAPAPPPLAGAPPARGRAGRSGRARPVPARLAGRRAGRRGAGRRSAASAALERLAEVVDQLAGLPIPASVLERDVLPARIPGYQPRLLDELGRARRGRLGGAGEPRPRRRPDRPGPAGPRDPAADRVARRRSTPPAEPRHDAIREHLARARRLVLPRAVRGGRRRRPTARCSTRCGTSSGPARSPTTRSRRCGRCAGSGPGAAARGARRPAGPADGARAARGGRPLVARRAGRGGRADAPRSGSTPRAWPCSSGTASLTREAVAAEGSTAGSRRSTRSCGRWRRPAGSGAATSSTASGPPSSRWPGALDRLRAVREPADPSPSGRGPPPGRRRPGQPVRRRARLAAPRRDRPAAAPARGRRLRRARRRRRGALPRARRRRRSRRCRPPTTRPWRSPRPAPSRALVADGRRPRARHPQGRRRRRRRVAVPAARCSRPASSPAIAASCCVPIARSGPECPRATRSSGPRRASGRTSSGGRSPRRGPAGPAPVPQVARIVGREITAVEALGKNLLIRFDDGLEIRTHLRMNGSWHRYRPGERWRRPPARARLVLEVPGAVAVCFDAPVVELLEQRAEALHPSLGRLGPDLLAPDFDADEARPPAARPGAGRRPRSPRRCRPAGAGRDRQRLQERDPVDRAGLAVRAGRRPRRRDARPLVATARRLLVANADRAPRPGAGHDRPATAARPARCTSTAGPAGRAAAAGRRSPARARARDLPRTTYWCPTCQPEPPDVDRAAYHRARCASTSSPGPPSRSGSTSCGRSPSGSSGSGSPGSAGARRGSTPTAGSARTATSGRSATTRAASAVGATETTAALVHLRRPSRLSTLTLAGHPAVRRPGRPVRVQPQRRPARLPARCARRTGRRAGSTAGPTPRSGRAGSRTPGTPTSRSAHLLGALHDRFGGQANLAVLDRRRHAAPLRGQRREPGLLVPARADRDRLDRDLLARPVALPVRRARRDGAPARPARARPSSLDRDGTPMPRVVGWRRRGVTASGAPSASDDR